MPLKYLILPAYLLLLPLSSCTSQATYIQPKVPAKYKKTLQEAISMAQAGKTDPAIASLREMIKKYPAWTEPGQALSRIYYEAGRKQDAIGQLESVLAIDTASQHQQLFTLCRLYEETGEPERAMACYAAVIRKSTNDPALADRAKASFVTLEKKRKLWDTEQVITFVPFDEDINSSHHEALGRWTLDGQKMIFTRLVNDQEDIFIASVDSDAGLWRIESFPFNSPLNEGAHAISPDGKYLIFTSCNRRDAIGSCDLYLSFIQNGAWTRPMNMGPAFNSTSWDGQPCFGLDGKSLFFSSARPGGSGGRDIWYVYQISPGEWSRPVNAGPAINTSDNEESPFVHFDGQTLYFMRDGKGGLGGYDLYMSRKAIDGQWQPAENLGAAINTGGHEGALTLHPDGRRVIITRETPDNRNDLFQFDLPEKYRSAALQALHATVLDKATKQPVRARLEIFETDGLDTIRVSLVADDDGKISMALHRGKPYGVMATAEGYLMHSSSLGPDSSAWRSLVIHMTALASAGDEIVILENIFFEVGSSAILHVSVPELNKLAQTLEKHPAMHIEIRGHTDNTGNKKDNQALSESRAEAVYFYLIEKGIDAGRLSYTGYGETLPIADNDTPEGRQKNRRTEFRVVGKVE